MGINLKYFYYKKKDDNENDNDNNNDNDNDNEIKHLTKIVLYLEELHYYL